MSEAKNTPTPICIGHTTRRESGGGIVHHEVAVHVGTPENRGNCVLMVVQGGEGGTLSDKEHVEAFAKHIVRSVNAYERLVELLNEYRAFKEPETARDHRDCAYLPCTLCKMTTRLLGQLEAGAHLPGKDANNG